jgi:hypothetical protein
MAYRIKPIQIDNLSFKIASFSMLEAEELLGKPITPEQVCISLNRAKAPDEAEWTAARLRAEVDFETLAELRRRILEMSGLKIETNSGEPAAAPEPTSVKSAAA